MDFTKITKPVVQGIRDFSELAAEKYQYVVRCSETPVGIAISPAFPLLVQNPTLSVAEKLFRDPEAQGLAKKGVQDIGEIYLLTENWPTLGMPLPLVIPTVRSPEASILIGASKFLRACQQSGLAQKDIHAAEDNAKTLVPLTIGERLLEQELQGLERLYEDEHSKPLDFLDPELRLRREAKQ